MSRLTTNDVKRGLFKGIQPNTTDHSKGQPEYYHLEGTKPGPRHYLCKAWTPNVLGRQYQIACDNEGNFHNPLDEHMPKHDGLTYCLTNKTAFTFYTKFLGSGDKMFLDIAERNRSNRRR